MTRVSLKEAYDNKDVVAQIYAIRDTAESAEDTAEQAVTTANTASDHVDALVPQVEGAVQNANSASASAQASAQTVAGYENRLATVESDLSAVTLRVQTAEGQIVTIEGRVTALETADGQNVKIDRINDYAVGLTGNQQKTGTVEFMTPLNPIKLNCSSLISGIQIKNIVDDSAVTPTSNTGYSQIVFKDMNDVTAGYLRFQHKRTGGYVMSIGTRNSSGSLIDTVIADVS